MPTMQNALILLLDSFVRQLKLVFLMAPIATKVVRANEQPSPSLGNSLYWVRHVAVRAIFNKQ